jgi:hypothetical protein
LHPETTFVFHDSEVRRIVADAGAGTLQILFSAARVCMPQAGAAGDDEDGYLAGVELQIAEARWTGPVAVCIGRLASGAVMAAGAHRVVLPLDADLAGELRIELQFANGSQLHVEARRLVMRAGEAHPSGDYAC